MGIQKPVLKPDPQHPSLKPDPSGATDSPPPPRIKSSVATRGSHQPLSQSTGCRTTMPASQKSKTSKIETGKTETKSSRLGLAKYPGDPEKWEIKDKSYDWIARCMARLDPKGFIEEIHSFWHFDLNSKTLAFEIIALVD